ncbi:HAD family hydrolase [Microbacterium amylolyticum]|uniref:HAD superfamily hydrolase (TIGR01549 family) n=1 Tax=Microbacterium amylolyticum TaxID=936337 RepID=A0ABS4ZL81_9MICO|nr:HAD family hydrolase [Microbacterium amylolyticum]MBP2437715.1 HAD superfamily hydrolase (TIGR01549 family) [Microbacterium amylolyticum]
MSTPTLVTAQGARNITDLPKALLLDFGGVIVASEKPNGWQRVVAEAIVDLAGAAAVPPIDRICADVTAGAVAAGQWRNAMSRPLRPAELAQTTFVMDFIAADWTESQRSAISPHVAAISYRVSTAKERRTLRPGIRELLGFCRENGIPVAIVSNALSGQVHRDFLAEEGLSDAFSAEIYSDEAGVRKPNPDFMLMGCEAVNMPPEDCWYVGDHLDRDVLCGTRAGIGRNVLMPSPHAATHPEVFGIEADLITDTPASLLDLMKEISDDLR